MTIKQEYQIRKNYPRGWKLLELNMNVRPEGIAEWVHALWGFDIWYEGIPLAKSIILANVIVWLVLK